MGVFGSIVHPALRRRIRKHLQAGSILVTRHPLLVQRRLAPRRLLAAGRPFMRFLHPAATPPGAVRVNDPPVKMHHPEARPGDDAERASPEPLRATEDVRERPQALREHASGPVSSIAEGESWGHDLNVPDAAPGEGADGGRGAAQAASEPVEANVAELPAEPLPAAAEDVELFQPAEQDRSPRAWAVRLQEAVRMEHAKRSPEAAAASQTPLSPSAAGVAVERGGFGDPHPADLSPNAQAQGGGNVEEAPRRRPGTATAAPSNAEASLEVRQGENIAWHKRERQSPDAPGPAPAAQAGAAADTPQPASELAEPRPAAEEAELFQPAERDRSPRAWAVRLQEAARMEHAKRPPGAAAASQTPLSPSARRFLKPLVGLDPASVRLRRDAYARQVAGAYEADAVTMENEVFLAADSADESPETLGVLAHELTHVARQRVPGFVPPVVRMAGAASTAPHRDALGDEESVARVVEARVVAAAHRRMAPPGPRAPEDNVAAARSATTRWGHVPAPWEPLPGWVTAPPEASPPVTMSPLPPALDHAAAPEPSVPAVQRAERGRRLEEAVDAAPPVPAPEARQPPEPDLDAIAQQVYAALKRRLSVEHRRGNG